jgi:hypothetical protein
MGDEYMCTLEHAAAGECLSFQLAPTLLEAIGRPGHVWRAGCVPPVTDHTLIDDWVSR